MWVLSSLEVSRRAASDSGLPNRLNAMYNFVIILLHRPFYTRHNSSTNLPINDTAIKRCNGSAGRIVALFEVRAPAAARPHNYASRVSRRRSALSSCRRIRLIRKSAASCSRASSACASPLPVRALAQAHEFLCSASNLPKSLHHALVTHLSSPTYPRHALLEKVELVCSFLSHRIGACIDSDDLGSYADDWRVRSGARVGSLLCASLSFFAAVAVLTSPSRACPVAANQQTRQVPPSAFYVTLIDSLGEQALIHDFEVWESQSGCVVASRLCALRGH